jgi:hypothetical protein
MMGKKGSIKARLEAMDKATQLLHDDFVRVPTVVDRAVMGLERLLDERLGGKIELVLERIKSLSDVTTQQFKSISDTFSEKDKAVSVGLSAQKESAAAQQASNNEAQTKMESNFTKLLDQGRELLTEVRRNTELQINDIKSRLDKGEGQKQGGSDSWQVLVSIGSLLIAAVAVIGLVLHLRP